MALNISHSSSFPPVFIAESDMMWYITSLWTVGVTCPACVFSQPHVDPNLLSAGSEWEKRASQYCVEPLTIAKMLVCYQHWFNHKLKTQRTAAMKNIHSIYSSTVTEESLVK